jgi:hypothetical protein
VFEIALVLKSVSCVEMFLCCDTTKLIVWKSLKTFKICAEINKIIHHTNGGVKVRDYNGQPLKELNTKYF